MVVRNMLDHLINANLAVLFLTHTYLSRLLSLDTDLIAAPRCIRYARHRGRCLRRDVRED